MLLLRPRTAAALVTLSLAVSACFSPSGAGASATSGDSTGDSTSTTGTTTSPTTTTAPTATTDATATTDSTSTTDPTSTSTPVTSTTSDPTTDSTSTSTTDSTSTSTSTSDSTSMTAICGNGSLETDEECDDGNLDNGDGCSANCLVEGGFCGNGVIDPGEDCDDGNLNTGDGCDENCQFEEAVCGNNIVEPGEECDGTKGCDEATCTWLFRYVFVSSKDYQAASLGGLTGADSLCTELAGANGELAGRTFRAWLSAGTDQQPIHAIDRIGVSTVPYQRVDNKTVASNTADFVDITDFMEPINIDESGTFVADERPVWTGTLNDGKKNPGDTQCGGWTESDGVGRVGLKSALGYEWTDLTQQDCSVTGHIYCVEYAG